MAKKVTVLISILILIFTVNLIPAPASAANELDQLYKELDNLQKEQNKNKKELADVNAQQQEINEQKAEIDRKMLNTHTQVNTYNSIIKNLDKQIKEENAKLDKQMDALQEYYSNYKERLRISYESGSVSYLNVLFGSESVGDFLKRYDYIEQLVSYDNKMMGKMKEQISEIELTKSNLDTKRQENVNVKAGLDKQESELSSQVKQSNKIIDELKGKQDLIKKNMAKGDAASVELNKKITALASVGTKYVGGEFAWPIPGYYNITSHFGPRDNYGGFHYGMDVSTGGKSGANVVASNDGTVIYTYYEYYGGNTLAIDHGGGRVTKYLHLSSFEAKVGETVKRGQTIAKSGNSGAWTTGPHLHFEIVINGTRVDPEKYVKK